MALVKNFLIVIAVLVFIPSRPARAADVGMISVGVAVCAAALFSASLGITETIQRRRLNRQHDEIAKTQGKTHLGHGIYFNGSGFFEAFTETERQFLHSPDVPPIEKARFLSEQLQGDYDDGMRQRDYDVGVDATYFLKGHGKKRGVCRHKSAVMLAALQYLGIEVTYSRSTGHIWVKLVKEQMAFDPTTGAEKDAKRYSKEVGEYELSETLSHMHWM